MKKLLTLTVLVLLNNICVAGNEVQCLANNIYYEASAEPYLGKVAVAKVTVNRTKDPDFKPTICGVVYQPGQFSWTSDKSLQKRRKDPKVWQECLQIARNVVAGYGLGYLADFSATHFHNNKVKPKWKLKRVAKIGNHTFYAKRVQPDR